ncbi:MAG: Nif3-like dinuclear metal center hexameric protein [Bacteroidia bacterium]|nr:Nif3-like dinuclear metal center hexameric protein [Bacteroidia bacterium]
MTKYQVIEALQELAPLSFQDGFDNAGLQVGLVDEDLDGVLVCLDITEGVVAEAARLGCNLIVSHHPLVFQPLKQVTDATWQQRSVMTAIKNGITIYSAHTNLYNAIGGVNYKIASLLGLQNLEWLEAKSESAGSGVVGELPAEEDSIAFLTRLKGVFDVDCVMHSEIVKTSVRRIAVCGGAGSFLMEAARAKGADCFITGEISYHHYFDADGLLLVALGHYQSEQFTKDLLRDFIAGRFPDVRVETTSLNTNPIMYLK